MAICQILNAMSKTGLGISQSAPLGGTNAGQTEDVNGE